MTFHTFQIFIRYLQVGWEVISKIVCSRHDTNENREQREKFVEHENENSTHIGTTALSIEIWRNVRLHSQDRIRVTR